VKHCLTALKGASQKKLTSRNVSVGFVGADAEFRILEGDAIKAYVNAVTNEDDEDEAEEKDAITKYKEEKAAKEEAEKRRAEAEEEAKAEEAAGAANNMDQ
jgi:hypothetical protein